MSLRTAFDSDVLIYAVDAGHPIGAPVARMFRESEADIVGVGSLLLLPEVLTKPTRADPNSQETLALSSLLSRLELHPLDQPTTTLAVALAVSYGLRAADSTHLATAVLVGADRFLTNNRRDFPLTISEIDIIYPDALP